MDTIEPITGQPIVTIEFLAEGTCRDCTENQCLFDDDNTCHNNNRHLEEESYEDLMGDRYRYSRLEEAYGGNTNDRTYDIGRNSVPEGSNNRGPSREAVTPSSIISATTHKRGDATILLKVSKTVPSRRYAREFEYTNQEEYEDRINSLYDDQHRDPQHENQNLRERLLNQDLGRCACRRTRSKRAPTQVEFRGIFQEGLDELTDISKGTSCEECDFNTDCQSNACLSGQCAEAATGLLLNGCACSASELCQSQFCNPNGGKSSSVCDFPLGSCATCFNNLDCLAGLCVAGRCAGDVTGTLLEVGCPCMENSNCVTSRCDTVGTGSCQAQLPICSSCTQDADCQSGVCVDGLFCGELIMGDEVESDGTRLGKLVTGCQCTLPTQCQTDRCATISSTFGDPGICAPKIISNCNEPCVQASDCASGVCGSIVCLPGDGSPLADGCFSNLDEECQSGVSQGTICVDASKSPSHLPSSFPTTQTPSNHPSASPSFSPCDNGWSGDGIVCILEDCINIPASELDFGDIYRFCQAHSGNECCFDGNGVGDGACRDWDDSSEYRICKGSCRGVDACVDWHMASRRSLRRQLQGGSGASVAENSCVGELPLQVLSPLFTFD